MALELQFPSYCNVRESKWSFSEPGEAPLITAGPGTMTTARQCPQPVTAGFAQTPSGKAQIADLHGPPGTLLPAPIPAPEGPVAPAVNATAASFSL